MLSVGGGPVGGSGNQWQLVVLGRRAAISACARSSLSKYFLEVGFCFWDLDFGIRFLVIVDQAVSCYQCLVSVRIWG